MQLTKVGSKKSTKKKSARKENQFSSNKSNKMSSILLTHSPFKAIDN